MTLRCATFTLSFIFLATGALAQADYYDSKDSSDRLDRLEHDLQVLQRQMAHGGSTPAEAGDEDGNVPATAMGRLSQIEENMRRLEGRIEELQHQNEELRSEMDRTNKDSEYRLKALEDKLAAMTTAQAAAAQAAAPAPAAAVPTPAPTEDAPPPAAPAKPTSSRDQYNAALQLLRQHKIDEANVAFVSYIKQNGKDPLIPNAYYWLGETYYVKGDFARAADSFRQGFELGPKGPKAGDNLLKLGMSLDAMKRTKEACVVFKQIGVKYPNTPAAIRAVQEMNRANCL